MIYKLAFFRNFNSIYYTFLSPNDFETHTGMHGNPTKMSQSQRMLSVPAKTQMNGSIFMPRKDSPFPVQIAEEMASQAQSATTMKSRY
jgi:hypothetical protein